MAEPFTTGERLSLRDLRLRIVRIGYAGTTASVGFLKNRLQEGQITGYIAFDQTHFFPLPASFWARFERTKLHAGAIQNNEGSSDLLLAPTDYAASLLKYVEAKNFDSYLVSESFSLLEKKRKLAVFVFEGEWLQYAKSHGLVETNFAPITASKPKSKGAPERKKWKLALTYVTGLLLHDCKASVILAKNQTYVDLLKQQMPNDPDIPSDVDLSEAITAIKAFIPSS